MIFKFQQFELSHSKSTMRVGTDAVVLGGYLSKLIADKNNVTKILDIGTGCGVLALIAAQKFPKAKITAIDIDENSFQEARENFIISPWNNRLEAEHISLQNFHKNHKTEFDLIISNPPYFENSLKSGNQLKDLARHNDNLPFNVLALCVEELLSKEGKFICILPTSEARGFIRTALIEGLFCNHTVEIFSKENDENPKRMVLLFQKKKEERINDRFVIGDVTYQEITDDLLI